MDERIDPVVFRLGTKEYKLVLPSPMIRLFEATIGKGFFQAKIPENWTETVTLLWAAAKTHSPHLRLDALFDYASPADLLAISDALGECIKRAFRTGEDKEGKPGEPPPLDS